MVSIAVSFPLHVRYLYNLAKSLSSTIAGSVFTVLETIDAVSFGTCQGPQAVHFFALRYSSPGLVF